MNAATFDGKTSPAGTPLGYGILGAEFAGEAAAPDMRLARLASPKGRGYAAKA
jgi:hypothetical protein